MTGVSSRSSRRGGSTAIRPASFRARYPSARATGSGLPAWGALLALLALPAFSAPRDAGAAPGPPRGLYADSLPAILGAESRGAQVGLLAVSLERGDTLLALREGDRFIPGSNVKVFPMGALLLRHGTGARRETIVEARGRVERDRERDTLTYSLHGDLVLHPTGMPDIVPLGTPGSRGLLDSLAFRLRAGGLRGFRGTLWLDRTLFADEPPPPGWAYDDFAYGYGAALGTFLANGNAVLIRAEEANGRVRFTLDPPDVPLRVRNAGISIGPPGGGGWLVPRWIGDRAAVELRGVVPRGGTVLRNVAMADPDSAAGVLFLAALRRVGMEIGRVRIRFLHPDAARAAGDGGETIGADRERDGDEPGPMAGGWGTATRSVSWDSVRADRYRVVGTLESPTLAHAVAVTATHSLNAESEALLRLNDPAERGKSREEGLQAVTALTAEAGIDTLDLSLVDGSGLSPQNLATPRALVRWLAHLESTPATRGALRAGLPEPGEPGTLEERIRGLPAGAALRAKTGSLTNVTALSGYVTTREGETLVFAMLTNGARRTVSSMRRAEERLVAFLARVPRERGLEVEPPGLPPR